MNKEVSPLQEGENLHRACYCPVALPAAGRVKSDSLLIDGTRQLSLL